MEVPRIHPDTVAEVKQRVDIVDVVADYVVLRKRGKDYLGLCPFHQEKTPSFTVNPGKQLYHCFGCGVGGNGISFLMEIGKTSFSEVVLDLAQRYQVPIKTLEPEQRKELQRQFTVKEQLYEILAVSSNFYQHALRQSQGEKALQYLQSERNLLEQTIEKFQLGYAPAGWETLYHYLVEVKHYPVGLVEEAGLIKKRNSGNGYYDQFRDRLMIPIHDGKGRVIAFGSRTLTSEEPKYLNSPETLLFDKGKTLFALDKAHQSISQQNQAILVEGYFDAISLHSHGINNVVASLGTAVSIAQLKQILRYTESKQIVLNLDNDTAGIKATQRIINEIETYIYSGQVHLKILHLPDGKDADEFLKSQEDAVKIYTQCLETAPLWLDWQIEQILLGNNLKQGDQFQFVINKMLKLLNKIDNLDLQTHYLSYCAEVLSQGNSRLIPLYVEKLHVQLKKPKSTKLAQKDASLSSHLVSEDIPLQEAEAELLLIYLHCPDCREIIINALEEKDLLFSFPHHRFLWQQMNALEDQSSTEIVSLLQERYLSYPEEMKKVAHLFFLDNNNELALERAILMINPAIATLERFYIEKYRSYCLEQWQKLNPITDTQLMQHYHQELENTNQKIKEIEKMRFGQVDQFS